MKPIRVQLRTKKGWKMPPNTVSVAHPSWWANPYAWWARGGHDAAAQMFRDDMTRSSRLREMAQRDLRGKNLACWCPLSEPCHADVLLEFANTRE
jgi:hypothetical protein